MADKDNDQIRKDMWKAMADTPYVMLGLDSDRRQFEPMYVALDKDADSEFWFYTKRDNRCAKGGPAHVLFVDKGHDLYASISGSLTEETDPAVIDRYWNKQIEAWYEQGRQDPSLLMLRFDLGGAEIWEGDMSLTGRFKMMTGQTIYDEESGSHANTAL